MNADGIIIILMSCHQVRPWFDEFGLEKFGFRLITKLTSCAAPPEIPHHPGFKVRKEGTEHARHWRAVKRHSGGFEARLKRLGTRGEGGGGGGEVGAGSASVSPGSPPLCTFPPLLPSCLILEGDLDAFSSLVDPIDLPAL